MWKFPLLAFASSLLAVGAAAPALAQSSTCTGDCKAGYEFAKELDLDDPTTCAGKSEAFIAGCQAYAQEELATSITDDDGGVASPDAADPGFYDEDAWKKF